MKSFLKIVVLLIGSAIVLSGCSAVSSMLFGESKNAAVGVQEPAADSATAAEEQPAPAEAVIRFTFYDSFANW